MVGSQKGFNLTASKMDAACWLYVGCRYSAVKLTLCRVLRNTMQVTRCYFSQLARLLHCIAKHLFISGLCGCCALCAADILAISCRITYSRMRT